MERYQGGCHCGAVRFKLSGPPMQSVYCHCSNCRRSTGAAFIMVGFWHPDAVQLAGGVSLLERATSSHLTRCRCPECGAPIYNRVRSERITANNVFLPLLDALDADARPTHHIYYADRVVDVEDGLPKFDRFKWLPRGG